MKQYRAAVIGCGRIGVEEGRYRKEVQPATHAGAYQQARPRIKLAGLADINAERLKVAARYFPGVPLFRSANDLLKEIRPDIVSIASHPDSHCQLVELAAHLKIKAIVCEKPIAETVKQAEKMIRLCQKSGSLLLINHTRRFDPLLGRIRKEMQAGRAGHILQGTCYYYNGLFNNGTHLVDLLRFFLGDIDWLMAKENKKTKKPSLQNDLNVDGMIHFSNGALVVLQSLPADYGFSEFYFYGDQGAFFLKNLGYRAEYRRLIKNKYYEGYYQLEQKPEVRGRPRSLMRAMVNHVVACLDGKEKPVSRGEDGLAALKILFALRESAQNNGRLIRISRRQ